MVVERSGFREIGDGAARCGDVGTDLASLHARSAGLGAQEAEEGQQRRRLAGTVAAE